MRSCGPQGTIPRGNCLGFSDLAKNRQWERFLARWKSASRRGIRFFALTLRKANRGNLLTPRRGRARRWAALPLAKGYPPFGQIVRRELDFHLVAWHDADEVF